MKTNLKMALCGFLFSLAACSGGGPSITSSSSNDSEDSDQNNSSECYAMGTASCAAFKATNAQRIANGVAIMAYCQTCYQMAAEQSQDMFARNYFSHDRSDETYTQRVARFDLSKGAGENIAYGKVGENAVAMWMGSASHRANILNPNFKSFAVGTYELYSTQVFYIGTDM